MADPEGYEPQFDFSDFQSTNPKRPLPGHELDVELWNISHAIGGTQSALSDIRRADGRLKNGIVDADAIGPTAVGALIGQSTELMEDVNFVAGMYLGQLANDPTTGRDGAALEPSNWYYNTATQGYRYYTPDGWRPMTGVATIRQYRYITTAGQTVISGLDADGFQYFASGQSVAVYKNGAALAKGVGYTTPNNTSIVLTSPAANGDTILVLAFEEALPTQFGRIVRRLHVANGTATSFAMPTGATNIGQVLAVAIDGVAQDFDKYTVAGSNVVLTAAPRSGERVQITAWTAVPVEDSNTRRAYAFDTRAAMLAAVGWPWEVGAVVSDGTVQYEYIGTGTAISDMPGWVPYGAIYPEHWGAVGWVQGQTASTADDTLRIKPAMDYASGLRQALNFIGGKNYRLGTSLVGNSNHISLQSDSDKPATLWTASGIGTAIDIFPLNPDLSATANLTNVRMAGITLWPLGSTLTDIGIRLRRVTTFNSENLSVGGYFNGFKEEACRNVIHRSMVGTAFNLNPAASGAAWYYRTGMLLDGTTWEDGFTTRFLGLFAGGAAYDALIQVGSADVIQTNHAYFGACKRHLLIKPDRNTARITGLAFTQTYFDGVQNPSPTECVVIDGNTFSGAQISGLRFGGCTFGQAKIALTASNSANLGSIEFADTSLQNMDTNAIFIGADTAGNLDLSVTGGTLRKWGLNNGGDANAEIGGRILKARSVKIIGMTIDADGANRLPFRTEATTSLAYVANSHATTSGMYTHTGTTERVAAANVGTNVFTEDTNTVSSGTLPNSSLKFGGVDISTLGGTYSSRGMNWYRFGNLITVNGLISLSAKGTATGAATITLPVAPVTGQGTVMGVVRPVNMTADAAVPAYVLSIPSNGTELVIRKYGTTGAPSANELSDTAFTNTTSINFSITYRVA